MEKTTTDILKEIFTNPAGLLVIGLFVYMIVLYIKHRWDQGEEERKARRMAKKAAQKKKAQDDRMKYWNQQLKKKYDAEHMSDKEFEKLLRKEARERRLKEEKKSKRSVSLFGAHCSNCGAPLSDDLVCEYCETSHILVG